jgi:hypothetical protein
MNEIGQEQGQTPELGGAGGGLEVPGTEPGEAGPAGLESLLEAAAGVGDAFGLASSAVHLISESAGDAMQIGEVGESLGAGLGGALEAGEAGPAGSSLEAFMDIGQAAGHAEERVSGDAREAIGAVGAAGGAVAERVTGDVSEAVGAVGSAGGAVADRVTGDVSEAVGAVGAIGRAVAGDAGAAAELVGTAGKAVFEKAGEMVESRPAGAGDETPPDQQAGLRVEAPRVPEQAPRDR